MEFSTDIIRKFAVFENLWIALLVGALLLVVWYGLSPFSEFKKLGIPGPAPWPFVGNLPDYSKKPGQFFMVDKGFVEKYGRVCGVYFGRAPVYIITDPDLLKQILVKEFSKFANRPFGAIGSSSVFTKNGLLQAQDEDWKRIRVTITPTFSALKLKQITPLVHQSCDTLCKKLEKIVESGEKVNMWRIYGKFTMEVILATAFGIQSDVQTNSKEPFTPNAEELFKAPALSAGLMVFPFLRPMLQFVTTILIQIGASKRAKSLQFMLNTANEVIQLRRQAGASQERPDYDTVQNLEYLDMVISETLRLYPPAFRFGRLCNESCTLNGVHFKKGMVVLVPVYWLHRDPEYWPDPEKFDPERFSKEAKQHQNPYCYLPFGTGPRSCIGMRFALMEAKMALVHLLKQFRFQRSEDTEVPLKLQGMLTMAPKNGIYVKLVPRA